MINYIIIAIGIISIAIQFFSRKVDEKEKPIVLAAIQYSIMAAIIILGGYSQYQSALDAKSYKKAVYTVSVLSKVSESYFPIVEHMTDIMNNYLSVHSYLSFEKAKKDYPELSLAIDWQ